MPTVELAEGQPLNFYSDLKEKVLAGTATKREKGLVRKVATVITYLEDHPRHARLNNHEISDLSADHGRQVWCSYVEEKIPGAYRMLWGFNEQEVDAYWHNDSRICVVAIVPHPEKGRGYRRVKLADFPE